MLLYRSAVMLLFQSTLPREERQHTIKFLCVMSDFNPRSHERSDPIKINADSRHDIISIHAPTRGATILRIYRASIIIDFNPRSHERSDLTTHHFDKYSLNFNPRSHERSDHISFFDSLHLLPISIHAPTRGATSVFFSFCAFLLISIHAPTRGATSIRVVEIVLCLLFQSTLPREERQQYCTKNLFIFIQYRQ